MKYLIDTDISSYYLRGKFNLVDIFEDKNPDLIRISRIALSELEVLAHRNPQSKINFSAITEFSQMLGIIEIDKWTWKIFSEFKANILSSGTIRGDFDILIASLAKQHNLVLVTNNVSHYEDLVDIDNWVEGLF